MMHKTILTYLSLAYVASALVPAQLEERAIGSSCDTPVSRYTHNKTSPHTDPRMAQALAN